jgi:hypothetical protein
MRSNASASVRLALKTTGTGLGGGYLSIQAENLAAWGVAGGVRVKSEPKRLASQVIRQTVKGDWGQGDRGQR